jgi:hypothetical protein
VLDTEAYVFGGGVTFNGNCPFKNSLAPTHSLKYSFLAAEWSYSPPGPRPGVLPTISPLPSPTEPNATWKDVTGGQVGWRLFSINIRYTVDHPHLRSYDMRIRSNLADPVHTVPGGSFTAGSFFFRGRASGPADPPTQSGGVPVDISLDPPCAYSFKLHYQTRHYVTNDGGDEVLYCIE